MGAGLGGRIGHEAGRGRRGRGAIFLGSTLGMDVAVGTRSFGIDRRWILHQTQGLGEGRLGWRG